MNDLKEALRQKAEAYQRRMQQAHAARLIEAVSDLAQRLQVEAADVGTPQAAPPDDGPERHLDADAAGPPAQAV